ncbi:uncharacterized protein LOC143694999 [Agelaius phoeniceus]|uniref:uncharacterized protein LOC143694999 n=1 Tax=Agelaius phoeniceus TaxID=39638 RepID=UPI004054DD82
MSLTQERCSEERRKLNETQCLVCVGRYWSTSREGKLRWLRHLEHQSYGEQLQRHLVTAWRRLKETLSLTRLKGGSSSQRSAQAITYWKYFLISAITLYCHKNKLQSLRSGKAGGFAFSLERDWWNSEAFSAIFGKQRLLNVTPSPPVSQAAVLGWLRRNRGCGAAPQVWRAEVLGHSSLVP